NLASRPFYQVADRILGSDFLSDIAEFFILFQTMYSGFVERARAVEALLAERRTTFVVVSTLEAAPAHEAEFFMKLLRAKRFHVGGLVLNRVLPAYLADPVVSDSAARVVAEADRLAEVLYPLVDAEAPKVASVLAEVGETCRNLQVVARAEATQRDQLSVLAEVVATAPELEADIHDLAGLLRLGRSIWG
ncbi:MAG: hypothetical protein M0T80_07815, partial [Actinomycetota bacterium]|nr:hypothetical protein [Actinomycetota bacterium]